MPFSHSWHTLREINKIEKENIGVYNEHEIHTAILSYLKNNN